MFNAEEQGARGRSILDRSHEEREGRAFRGNGHEPPPLDDGDFPPGASKEKPGGERIKSFPAVWFSDAQMPEASHAIIKNLIYARDLVIWYGESGTGKTFTVFDMLLHVACGMSWRGRRVTKCLVVYIAAEAGKGILKRVIAWRENKIGEADDSKPPFVILTRGPNLLDGVDVEVLKRQLRELSASTGLPIGIVVFDTLSRSVPGGEENSGEDMGKVILVADQIRDEFDAATILVHHCGKDTNRGMRGWSGLKGAADVVVYVENGLATVEKMRDNIGGEKFPFKLRVVEVGTDEDGDPITTCLVDHDVEAPAPSTKGRAENLAGVGKVAFRALQEAISDHGEPMPGTSTIPGGVRAVTLEQWRERFRIRYGSDDKKPDSIRIAFKRGREALQKAELIGISDPYCWLTNGRAQP